MFVILIFFILFLFLLRLFYLFLSYFFINIILQEASKQILNYSGEYPILFPVTGGTYFHLEPSHALHARKSKY